jgi:hypothetical protein
MSPEEEKEKVKTSIGIVVSFDGSSKDGCKIVMQRIDGSEVTLTTMVDIKKDGMTYIRDHGWNKMFEISGLKAIVEMKESGNEQS